MSKYVTKQRKLLLNFLSMHIDEELSAKYVAEQLKEEGVSQSAVYRNLADLENEKLIVQSHKEGSREFFFRYVYDDECKQSIHMKCQVCGQMNHLPRQEADFLAYNLMNYHNFEIDTLNTVIYGVCQSCKIKEKEDRK
ncbi:Fur family transcriptional regulator [Tannockella kyphosi]|uniref:Fur family transcriptional regulator n=1 Tax=Tannockella kyphosi TaxID=2899121 RepID=UPI002010D873|nr:transcriptional repressor [Tannockella kyphosi]